MAGPRLSSWNLAFQYLARKQEPHFFAVNV
jgi:hypothetical protein